MLKHMIEVYSTAQNFLHDRQSTLNAMSEFCENIHWFGELDRESLHTENEFNPRQTLQKLYESTVPGILVSFIFLQSL